MKGPDRPGAGAPLCPSQVSPWWRRFFFFSLGRMNKRNIDVKYVYWRYGPCIVLFEGMEYSAPSDAVLRLITQDTFSSLFVLDSQYVRSCGRLSTHVRVSYETDDMPCNLFFIFYFFLLAYFLCGPMNMMGHRRKQQMLIKYLSARKIFSLT